MSIDQWRSSVERLSTALGAVGRFHVRFTFIGSERKELLALSTGTDLEIRGPVRIDVGRKQQFIRIVSNRDAVGKLDHGKTVVEDFEGGFLPFALDQVAHDENRLTFPLRPKIA